MITSKDYCNQIYRPTNLLAKPQLHPVFVVHQFYLSLIYNLKWLPEPTIALVSNDAYCKLLSPQPHKLEFTITRINNFQLRSTLDSIFLHSFLIYFNNTEQQQCMILTKLVNSEIWELNLVTLMILLVVPHRKFSFLIFFLIIQRK